MPNLGEHLGALNEANTLASMTDSELATLVATNWQFSQELRSGIVSALAAFERHVALLNAAERRLWEAMQEVCNGRQQQSAP
jgi:hypothetical protein